MTPKIMAYTIEPSVRKEVERLLTSKDVDYVLSKLSMTELPMETNARTGQCAEKSHRRERRLWARGQRLASDRAFPALRSRRSRPVSGSRDGSVHFAAFRQLDRGRST